MSVQEHLWAIVLAGGDGLRASESTRDETGRAVPKQYCSFGRQTSMLRWALTRACGIVPIERVVAVVAEQHRLLWERELSDLPADNIVTQPRNRGTAVGLLLAMLHISLRYDDAARVLVLPSDHSVEDEEILRSALSATLDDERSMENRLVLLGMTKRDFDHEYGWIVPALEFRGEMRDVARFVEKPDYETARDHMGHGALVNSMMMAGEVRVILKLYEETCPEILHRFLDCLREKADRESLGELYDRIPTLDFSRDILERAACHLSVRQVPECGWSDLGTTSRIQTFKKEWDARSLRALGKATYANTILSEENAAFAGMRGRGESDGTQSCGNSSSVPRKTIRSDRMKETLSRFVHKVFVWLGWSDLSERRPSPAHGWLLPTPSKLGRLRAGMRDPRPDASRDDRFRHLQ